METLQNNRFFIRYPLSSGMRRAECTCRPRVGIVARKQFVSVIQSEVCGVMSPELWSNISSGFFPFDFFARIDVTVPKERRGKKKKTEKTITSEYSVIRKNKKKTQASVWGGEGSWGFYVPVCCRTICRLSQSTVRSKGLHDQNIVITPKCEVDFLSLFFLSFLLYMREKWPWVNKCHNEN